MAVEVRTGDPCLTKEVAIGAWRTHLEERMNAGRLEEFFETLDFKRHIGKDQWFEVQEAAELPEVERADEKRVVL